jgi:hypothetical protein
LPPFTVFLLATGLERVAIGADILAALDVRTPWSAVVRPISVPVTVPILAAVSISPTVGIPATIRIVPLVVPAIPACTALKASVDILDFSAAALKVAELSRLPSATGVLAGGVQC